ncbi:hypothetical protein IW140_001218 [Coemansia sp. RSA 1813]|nr:hypothetical protein EV178_001192 [Coemansia sp. RSA 1646]KAJ1772152.1 hypothetical protein LPJ74_001737 [Coemansia sp. RSA 1843]KAJ2091729.1 hypothetical protein IW138_001712 [Coemansia sp. RSA 986]KAJ2216867.1 hypothetical protein EV179_000901 [Coemansia sp. RSA 487]KAJ2571869.1 hypothetical protein IW140_001218 [Coemansia sp. RSA 1813]
MKADADISSNGSYGTHEGETEDSEDEYAIGFSLEEWEYEVGGWVVLPTGLEKTLTAQILHTYETRLFPSAESIELKRAFIEKFATILTNEFPDLEVDIHVFGSSVNGLGTSRSDVDICLTTEHRELENVFLLNKALRKHGMRTYCVPQARVPIVKAWDPELRVASDININSTIALHNTRMIQTFVAIDSRVRPFVMAVKHWTKCRELNDAAFGGTLSPYAWVNVALNFLQTRSPPILPVLHPPSASLSAQETTREGNLDLAFNDNIDELRGFGLANTESLGFLLYAFFRRYAYEFDYRYQVVSLRHGCTLTKTQKGWDTGRPSRIFCIEEPFLTWLNLGHSANTTSVEGIRQEFKRGFQILRNGGSFEMVCEAYKRPQRSLALSPVTSVSTANTAVGRPQRNTSAVAGDHRSAPQHSRSRSHLHERNGGRHRSTSSSCSSSGFVPERLEYRRSSSFHPDKKPYHHPQHDSNCYQQQEYHDYGYAHIQPNSAATLADTFQRISLSASEEHDDTMDNQLATANDSTLTAADYAKLPSSYSAGYCRSPYGIYHSTISLPQEHAVQRKDSYDGMTYCSAAVPEGEGEYPSGPRNRSRQRIQHWHATPSHIYAHHQHDGYELAHHHCTQDGVYHHYSG